MIFPVRAARLAVLLAALAASPARADSLDQLIDRAMAEHPSVQALEAALAAAEAAVGPAGAWPDPEVSWLIAPDTFGSDRLSPRHIYGLSQRLPWPGKRALNRAAMDHEAAARADDLAALRLKLAGRIRQLHAQWLYLEAAIQANADNQQLVKDLGEVALVSYGAGRASQQAVTEAQLRLAVLRQDALLLRSQREAVAAQWNAMLNRPADAAAQPPPAAPALPDLPPAGVLQDAARRANPELAALDQRIAAGGERHERARRDYFPDLVLKASYVGTLDPEEKRAQVGLALELPLNLGRRRDALDAAAAQQQGLQWQRADRLATIEAEILGALAAARTADDQLQLYAQALLPHAQENLHAARAAWQSGEGDFPAVIAAAEQLLRLRLGREAARRDAITQRSTLDRLSGGQLTDTIFGGTAP